MFCKKFIKKIRSRIKRRNLPSFSEVLGNDGHFPGKKMLLKDILSKNIILLDFRVMPSTKHPESQCLWLHFELDGEECVLFTGSAVLIKQCQNMDGKLPINTKIVTRNRYFTFT